MSILFALKINIRVGEARSLTISLSDTKLTLLRLIFIAGVIFVVAIEDRYLTDLARKKQISSFLFFMRTLIILILLNTVTVNTGKLHLTDQLVHQLRIFGTPLKESVDFLAAVARSALIVLLKVK